MNNVLRYIGDFKKLKDYGFVETQLDYVKFFDEDEQVIIKKDNQIISIYTNDEYAQVVECLDAVYDLTKDGLVDL